MKFVYAYLLLLMSLVLPISLHAQGQYPEGVALNEEGMPDCLVEATPAQHANAGWIGVTLLKILEAESKKSGNKMSVALIARRGTALGSSIVLKDTDAKGNVLTINDIYKDVQRLNPQGFFSEENAGRNPFFDYKERYEDKSRELKFSHMGAVLKNLKSENGLIGWMGAHKLKPCYDGRSHIYKEGLAKFYLDAPYEALKEEGQETGRTLMAQIIIPKFKYHKNLERLFIGDLKIRDAYWNIKYNLAALPFQLDEINSNQYVLEAVAAAQMNTNEIRSWGTQNFRRNAQEVLQNTGYRPTKVALNGLYALAPIAAGIGSLFGFLEYANPNHQEHAGAGLVEVIAAKSVVEYMQRQQMVEKIINVYMPTNLIAIDAKK